MFFNPNTIIFMQRSGLLVSGRRLPSMRLDFPDDIVHNLEVVVPGKLASLCQKFFAERELHGKRLLIVLDYSVVFEKTIELDQSGKPDLIMEGFVAAMPFEPGQRACLAYQSGSSLRLFATNADLYQAVANALSAANAGSLAAITPIAAYNLGNDQRTIRTASDYILKQNDISHQLDFNSVVPS